MSTPPTNVPIKSNFQYLKAFAIQCRQYYSHCPPDHPDAMGENNTYIALKGCEVTDFMFLHKDMLEVISHTTCHCRVYMHYKPWTLWLLSKVLSGEYKFLILTCLTNLFLLWLDLTQELHHLLIFFTISLLSLLLSAFIYCFIIYWSSFNIICILKILFKGKIHFKFLLFAFSWF